MGFVWLLVFYAQICIIDAVIPTGILSFQVPTQKPRIGEFLCSPSINAGWGVEVPEMKNAKWNHIYGAPLTTNSTQAYGCEPYTLPSFASAMEGMVESKSLVVVDRGNCSFLQKTQFAEQAGARGIVIRGTKQAIYESIMSRNISNTSALVDAGRPAFEYDCQHGESFVSTLADPVWSTDDPICHTNPQCASQLCVLTGRVDSSRRHQVCCLWDTSILMGANRTQAKNVSIPVVYITIADGLELERLLIQSPNLLVRIYTRAAPFIDIASLLLWMMGVATAIGAAYYSAANDREKYKQRMDSSHSRKHQVSNEGFHVDEHNALELDTTHAIGFIVCAGLFLILLYYVKASTLIPILFGVSATVTVSQLVLAPLLYTYAPILASRQTLLPFIHEAIPLTDVFGMVLSGGLALLWYIYRRSCWILQDFFGIVICFTFLRTIQLPNLKVATVLLVLAFVYDVFFVFISPLVFGSSVMEDVATGGPAAYTRSNYPGIDYCERYPDYKLCIDPEPMPMLLTLPRIMDWMGGMSMLGLGDIILPGLLLSFALRFDYSPQALQQHNYFGSVAIGYAVGLGMANLAVTIMQLGQPALMYLVPTCLGTLILQSHWNNDLNVMWLGIGMHDADSDKRDEEVLETGMKSGGSSVVVNDDRHDHAPLLGNIGGPTSLIR